MQTLTLPTPDDLHIHLRDGAALARHAQRISHAADPVRAGRELKAIVLITCAVNLLFSLGLCFAT